MRMIMFRGQGNELILVDKLTRFQVKRNFYLTS